MNTIQFQYRKSPENITDREAIILSPASNNYLTLDITELDKADKVKLEAGLVELQKGVDEAFTNRNNWLRDNGYNTCYRSFTKDKMSQVIAGLTNLK
jgi:hypothetical protein